MSDTSSEPNYQDILNKYAAELNQNPPEPEAQSPEPQPESTSENLISLPQPEPQAQLTESQPDTPQPQSEPQPESIASPPPAPPASPLIPPSDDLYTPLTSEPATDKGNSLFKVLFFLSLLLFLGVATAVVYSFINSQKPLSNNQNTPSTGSSPTVSASTCKINEQEYSVDESFAATDGCNTCTCHPDLTISCTEKACDTTPTKSATLSASPSVSTLRSQVEDWKTYTKSSPNLSWDKCGNSETEISKTIKDTISKETAYFKEIDNYKIYYTPKLNFTVEDLKKFKICAVGDNTPRKIIGDKILWADGCGGISDETSEKCDNIMKQVEMLYKL